MEDGRPLVRKPAAEGADLEQRGGMLAADVPGDMAAALPLEAGHQAPAARNDHGLVARRHQSPGDLEGPLLDTALFESRQHLDDLQGMALA